jgi:hypothetical protein
MALSKTTQDNEELFITYSSIIHVGTLSYLRRERRKPDAKTPHNPEARDAAEEEVVANARQIASTMTPFYGEAAAAELYSLLDINYGAVKEHSEAIVTGNKRRQDAALTRLAPNADDIAVFLNSINPYLSHDHVRSLIAAHGPQINQCKEKNCAQPGATSPMMRHTPSYRRCHDDRIAETVSAQVLMTQE